MRLAPLETFALWRRMTLWEITSYADALARERDRQLARAELRERHGRGWRRKAPRRTRVLLKLGELAPAEQQADTAVRQPCAGHAPEHFKAANGHVARRTPSVPEHPPAQAAETTRRAYFEQAELERTRQNARRTYAESLNAGHPIGPKALGEAYGFSEGWGRKQIKAVQQGRVNVRPMAVPAAIDA
ncbi:hypothetical protein [Actinacidiphila oryziradicis]|uniref:hypothetical protein n=1 Tax=Actinacidiphila oryziradicis TaxID=2571141 RepID=UPI00267D0BA3|nr:hypothetical protein [Actinacidiphila oryziradicis]